jgi:predicted DNA-binding WGR domain protein
MERYRSLFSETGIFGSGPAPFRKEYLIYINPALNSRKFYSMEQINPYEFKATWGKMQPDSYEMKYIVGQKICPMKDWNVIKGEKLEKGYDRPKTAN